MATGKGYFPLLGRSYSTNIDLSLTSDSNKIKHGMHCDVALKISQDRRLRAHRVVLVSFSPYFKALLGKHWDDGVEKEIEFLGFDENAVSDLIEFAYSGKININKDNVQTLLEASNYLQVEFVKKSCGDFLKDAIDDETCLNIWQLADCFSLEKLRKTAKRYALQHFTEICKEEEFLSLPIGFLKEILADEGICVVIENLIPVAEERERAVLEAVFKYVEHDLANRKKNLPELLSLVRLPTISKSYLKEILLHKLLANSCTEWIAKAQRLQIDSSEKDSPDERWATTRAFAKPVVWWGRCFASDVRRLSVRSHHSDEMIVEDLRNDVFIKGMDLWIRQWCGTSVLGGLRIFYNGDREVKFGSDSSHCEHHEFHLKENERIVRVEVNSGLMINQLQFFSNKKDDNGEPKCYGPYGGDGGGFFSETPPGSYGFLAGIGAAVVYSQGEEGITRLQFAWRTYVLPGNQEPMKSRCSVNDYFHDYDDDEDDEENFTFTGWGWV